MPILDEFYKPIFEKGYIQEVYFIPGWEYSFGARWELEECKRLGIKIEYLPENWISSLGLDLS